MSVLSVIAKSQLSIQASGMVPSFSPHFSELFETQHGVFWTPSKKIFFLPTPKTWSKSGKIEEKGPIWDQIGPISSGKSNEPKSWGAFLWRMFLGRKTLLDACAQ